MDARKNRSGVKRKGAASNHNNNNNSGTNGFKALGLSDHVYRGIVKMGFRVSAFTKLIMFTYMLA